MKDQKGSSRRTIKRYSLAFKQKVVHEVENSGLSYEAVRVKYGIGSSASIHYWIKQLGKNHLLGKKVRIEMADELSVIKQLEQRIRDLEKGIAHTQLQNLANEQYLDIACKELGVNVEDFKKKRSTNSI
jgi:transposase-like protein